MNKKILSLVLVSALAFSLAGCQVKEKPTNTTNPSPVSESGQKPGAPQGITVNDIKTEKIKFESLDSETQKTLEDAKTKKGYKLIKDKSGEFYYLAVFGGEKPNGGYGVNIVKVEDNEGKTIVTVEDIVPGEDSMNIQVITYPMDIVKLKGITENITLNFVAQNKGQADPNTPVSSGGAQSTLVETTTINAVYEGQIDNNSIEVKVNGVTTALRLRDASRDQLKQLNLQKGDSLKIDMFKDNGQEVIYSLEKATSSSGKKAVQSTLADYVGQIDNNSIEVNVEDGPVAMRLTDLAKEQLASLKLQKGDSIKIETFKNDNGQQTIQLIEKAK